MYKHQQNKWYPQRCSLLQILKLHSIVAVANLLAYNNITIAKLLWTSKFAMAKIECSFEMGK